MPRTAFSTLGCPNADVTEVLHLARIGPTQGIELRCAPGQLITPETTDTEADALAAQLRDAGIEVVCLATYLRVATPTDDADVARHLELAARFDAPFVRVFGGGTEHPDGRRERALETLDRAAELAAAIGVDVALETHDSFPTGAAVADLLATVGSPHLGAVWDALHPWRAGEPVAATAAALGPWLRNVQFKDVASVDDTTPVLPGHGVLPLDDVRAQLRRLGYTGWISLEWERAWYPEAAPLADALAAFHQVLDA
ncbi:sugar phosphate isomerase/epimerase family protein [Pseudonocardia sp. CA-107938]|uniref:sugar phosphate isomerase/epimerase family protein n=1 Tax=Pseudonocardia sp. CA-107938 TaxID=3240021 RepID=UPI003D90BB80